MAANLFSSFWCARMEIKVNFLDNLRLEAKFDDFTVIADQPIRYKGDGSAPGPFDYFLASSALSRKLTLISMRAHQNNELNKLAAIMKIFTGKSQGFANRLLIGANVHPPHFEPLAHVHYR